MKPRHASRLVVISVAAGVALSAAVGLAQAGAPAHPSETFVKLCSECHGTDGKAQTPKGQERNAPVFADAKWRDKKRSKVDKLVKSVLEGRGKKMPGFKDQLSEEQARALIEKDVLADWP
jgi:mono/diheme cytochrome c family protein